MKAMLLSEYKKLSLVEMPVPAIGPEDLLVQVKACGICGSDIHGYDGSTGRRIPPLVMGHEAAGVVSYIAAYIAISNTRTSALPAASRASSPGVSTDAPSPS